MEKRTTLKVPGILISLGAIGNVSKVNDRIVVKTPRIGGTRDEYRREKFASEIENYDFLEAQPSLCPDIARSFLRIPNANFLALCSGGNLFVRLQQHQLRKPDGPSGRLVEIRAREPIELVEQWIMELSSAVAWLESLTYAHTDLRPENLIFDSDDHLKLTDFDSMEKIGTRASGCAPPWARCLGPEAGSQRGSFGDNGARYESFAIGSVLYFMTRGHEPYDDATFGPQIGAAKGRLLQLMLFPSLGTDALDNIIRKCWHSDYQQLEDLAKESKCLPGYSTRPRATLLNPDIYKQTQEECRQLVANGFLKVNQ
ncbi:CBL-interacting serine/threonine-protein kinase [Lachnellula willkommii]|uniref:CBL-interacting serine/threonine-protein kinase n=1 Tax=Lachnellula willkommii TaxID=215461 RepID=A0A559M617_9HELO|nr:CBL-interacting serine/threonine-protein kinase [Lachnellula willkommii]